MTSREALRSYRDSTKDRAAHERVYFYHAHIYYDSSSAKETSKMRDIMKSLHHYFDSDDHVEIHTLQDKAVGPHPEANLEVLFTRERYTHMLNYLAFALPTSFSALIHQLTADQVGDHTTRAVWVGKQAQIKPEILKRMDQDSAARGLSEEEIIWAVHSH